MCSLIIRCGRTHLSDREHLKEVIFDIRKQEMSFNDYVDDLANTWHAQDVTSSDPVAEFITECISSLSRMW
jgi:hypothetical protein